MGKYEQLAKDIVKNIGGKENIHSLTHCITRLRFRLKDESRADDEVLKGMDGVVTVMKSAGQYQVVIGNHVPQVYEEVCSAAGILPGQDSGEEGEQVTGIFNKLIDIISGCFQPFLGAMSAAGMIKGLNALFIFFGLYEQGSGIYQMLNGIGDSIFYFMPIILGYTSAVKFKLKPFVGMVIGAALCYPDIQAGALSAGEAIGTLFSGSIFESAYYLKFLGIPWLTNDYTSSVIPVIAVVWFAGRIQRAVKKVIPEMVQNFLVPFFVLLISLPVGYLLIGPVITFATSILGSGFSALYNFSPILLGIVTGFFWQILVIFGLHWSLIPLAMMNLGLYGMDTVLTGTFAASFAQTAVVMAMFFKLKNVKQKELCIPAVISGICGVTEPAIYGITLPKKRPFIYSLIGGAAGGAIMSAFQVKAYTMGGLGIFGVVNYINLETGDASGMRISFLAILVSMAVGFLLTFFFWKDDSPAEEKKALKDEKSHLKQVLNSPIKGAVIPLNKVKDDAFAGGALGLGVAIVPSEGRVSAPFDGTVMALFPANHAIGLVSDEGMEILIHIGLDTVQLQGKHFEAHVAQGQKVKAGQLMISFDIPAVEREGYSVETPVIVSNSADYMDIFETDKAEVEAGEPLLTAIL